MLMTSNAAERPGHRGAAGCSSLRNGTGRRPARSAGGSASRGASRSSGPAACGSTSGARRDGSRPSKSGPHRIVYRVDLPEGAVYVKHYLVPDYRAMFRQWFRRGKGRNEGKRSSCLDAIGVPTITPIALGEQRKRELPLRELPGHAGDPRDRPARRVPREPPARLAGAAAVAASVSALAGRWPS